MTTTIIWNNPNKKLPYEGQEILVLKNWSVTSAVYTRGRVQPTSGGRSYSFDFFFVDLWADVAQIAAEVRELSELPRETAEILSNNMEVFTCAIRESLSLSAGANL